MYRKIGFSILFFWLLFVGTASSEEISVSTSEELQAALANGEGLKVIKVKSGEYFGNFIISHSIHLVGEKGAKLIGPSNGNVLAIEADDVIVEGFQVEGGGSQNAGIYVKGNRSIVQHNEIRNVFHGIYSRDGYGHQFKENIITSYNGNQHHKGYGIYLVNSPNTVILGNLIYDTQDGVYVSYSDYCEVKGNQMVRARYGVHTMDSRNVLIAQNQVRESVNGLMIMQSYEVFIIENFFYLNTKIDGAGMFIYDTFDSKISSNLVRSNFKGILMENAQRNTFEFNTFLENNCGMEIRKNSSGNTIYLNNFTNNIQSIISDKENSNRFNKDNYGNYYNDHGSINLNGDDLVDFAYKSGDVFYNMTRQEPYLQVFYQSPAVELWNMIEQFTPMPSDAFVVDEKPLVKPAPVKLNQSYKDAPKIVKQKVKEIQVSYFFIVLFGSVFILICFGREKHEV